MARILLFIAPANFRDEELFHTKEELEKAGHSVVVGSTERGVIPGASGGSAVSEKPIEELNASDFDAVFFIGGPGVFQLKIYEDERVLRLAREASASCRFYGAICVGPRVLAKAGVISGKRLTAFNNPETLDMIRNAGGIYTGASVEQDGKLITANGPQSSYDFGKRIAYALA